MTTLTTAHRLVGEFPAIDTYAEIGETHSFPGGEAGSAAVLLAGLGYRTRLAGPHLGLETRDAVQAFCEERGIDCSEFAFDPGFGGVRDLVLVAGTTRTVFGWFGAYFQSPKRWSPPVEESIRSARIVAIDPFFGEESELAARLCVAHGTPYVTIDCEPDSYIHRHAAATIIANEYVGWKHGDEDRDALFRSYVEASDGLTVFTHGTKPMMLARQGQATQWIEAFRVDAVSTLGAGDTFRAGLIHGLLSGYSDVEAVRFAAATSACVCRRFPMAADPPRLDEIQSLISSEAS